MFIPIFFHQAFASLFCGAWVTVLFLIPKSRGHFQSQLYINTTWIYMINNTCIIIYLKLLPPLAFIILFSTSVITMPSQSSSEFLLLSLPCVSILWSSFLSVLSLPPPVSLDIQDSPWMILILSFTPKTIPLVLTSFITKTEKYPEKWAQWRSVFLS